jgi:hypothetical protein
LQLNNLDQRETSNETFKRQKLAKLDREKNDVGICTIGHFHLLTAIPFFEVVNKPEYENGRRGRTFVHHQQMTTDVQYVVHRSQKRTREALDTVELGRNQTWLHK